MSFVTRSCRGESAGGENRTRSDGGRGPCKYYVQRIVRVYCVRVRGIMRKRSRASRTIIVDNKSYRYVVNPKCNLINETIVLRPTNNIIVTISAGPEKPPPHHSAVYITGHTTARRPFTPYALPLYNTSTTYTL